MKNNDNDADAFEDLMHKVFSYSVLTPTQESKLEEDLHWAMKTIPLTTIIPVKHICTFIEAQSRLATIFLQCSWSCRKHDRVTLDTFPSSPHNDMSMDLDYAEGNEHAFDLFWDEILNASQYSLHILDAVYQLFVRPPLSEPPLNLAAAKHKISQFVSKIMSRASVASSRSAVLLSTDAQCISNSRTLRRIFTFLNAILVERPGFLLDLVLELESFALRFSNLQEAILFFQSLRSLQQMPFT